MRQGELVVKYWKHRHLNRVYGVVTPYFRNLDLALLREILLEEVEKAEGVHLNAYKEKRSNLETYGIPYEVISVENPNSELGLECLFFYAKNNGYSAVKAEWGRWVQICSNGLSTSEEHTFVWKHTSKINIRNFIQETLQYHREELRKTQNAIKKSKDLLLTRKPFEELLCHLKISSDESGLLKKRLKKEIETEGITEWALSQTLTWMGSHQHEIPFNTRKHLTDVGTQILDMSLEETLRTFRRLQKRIV